MTTLGDGSMEVVWTLEGSMYGSGEKNTSSQGLTSTL